MDLEPHLVLHLQTKTWERCVYYCDVMMGINNIISTANSRNSAIAIGVLLCRLQREGGGMICRRQQYQQHKRISGCDKIAGAPAEID
jgi:hypothetical protein